MVIESTRWSILSPFVFDFLEEYDGVIVPHYDVANEGKTFDDEGAV